MVAITTRAAKGAALTHNELDANFNNLNTAVESVTESALQQATTSATNARSLGLIPIVFETGFSHWDFMRFPVKAYRSSYGNYFTDYNPRTDTPGVKDIFSTTQIYYVDDATGNDSNNGTSDTTPKKTISAAITAGNAASATSYIVYIKAGVYPRTGTFHFNNDTIFYNKPAAFIGYGGQVFVGPIEQGVAWNLSSGTTYVMARSNTARVINRLRLDKNGDPVPYVKLADKAAVDAYVGTNDVYSFTSASGSEQNNVYAKRADGAAVNYANTFLTLASHNLRNTNLKHTYASGITLIGGMHPFIGNAGAGQYNAAFEDMKFLYAGADGVANYNGATYDMDGLIVFNRCGFAYNMNDGPNPHGNNAGSGRCHTLVINGYGYRNGQAPALSCNNLTGHGDDNGERATPVIAFNFNGEESMGGAVRFVGTSQAAIFSSDQGRDRGDGSVLSAGVLADQQSKVYLYGPAIYGCLIAMRGSTSGGRVYYREPRIITGRIDAGVEAF